MTVLDYPAVRDVFAAYSLLQVSPLPTVPVRTNPVVAYDKTIRVVPEDQLWYVRSFGTRFELPLPPRRSVLLSGSYSFGWGLIGERETRHLLLVAADAGVIGEIERFADALNSSLFAHVESCVQEKRVLGDRNHLRFAAELRPTGKRLP